jgi:hypothetical protein
MIAKADIAELVAEAFRLADPAKHGEEADEGVIVRDASRLFCIGWATAASGDPQHCRQDNPGRASGVCG